MEWNKGGTNEHEAWLHSLGVAWKYTIGMVCNWGLTSRIRLSGYFLKKPTEYTILWHIIELMDANTFSLCVRLFPLLDVKLPCQCLWFWYSYCTRHDISRWKCYSSRFAPACWLLQKTVCVPPTSVVREHGYFLISRDFFVVVFFPIVLNVTRTFVWWALVFTECACRALLAVSLIEL